MKLTTEFAFVGGRSTTSGALWSAYNFVPSSVPGFSDYFAVYSQFRILKARLDITYPMASNSSQAQPWPTPNSFLVVPSRTFASTSTPVASGGAPPGTFVPEQAEAALRQTRYQYQVYPSRVTNRLRVSFKPYTMVSTGGPTTAAVDTAFQRIWEGRKWSPFSWINGSQNDRMTYFGPYLVTQGPRLDPIGYPVSYEGQLTLYCQFRGQK